MNLIVNQPPLSQVYQDDFLLWIERTVQQLKARDIDHLDWENLIEEIEDLGREQRHKVDSYSLQLLIHLLLYTYWQQEKVNCQRGWKNEIGNFRLELDLLFESKTLHYYYLERLDFLYPKARKRAIEKSELSAHTFPERCPFTAEQLLDSTFFPEIL